MAQPPGGRGGDRGGKGDRDGRGDRDAIVVIGAIEVDLVVEVDLVAEADRAVVGSILPVSFPGWTGTAMERLTLTNREGQPVR